MAFGARTVAQRDVEFNVNLGQFRAQLGEAGRLYAQTTGQMSTESLRLSVAEERVARAIKLHGAESIQARNATVSLRREVSLLSGSARESESSLLAEERALGRFSRGALAAAGVSSQLKRALLLGSGSFLVGAGLAQVLRASLDAAKNEEAALAELQVALKNAGSGWDAYGAHVDEALQAQVKATGFTREELTQTLTQNVRRFGNLADALKANALAADVARQKNIGLADAQNLIQRASLGQSRSLLTLGISYTKTTANVDALKASTSKASAEQLANAKAADLQANKTAALEAIFAKFHGSAAKFLQTSAGKQALFNAELKDSEEIIGQALLPTINHYLDRLSSWLDKMNRSGRLQKDVNTAMHAAAGAGHVAEDAFHGIEEILGPLNHLLGGTEKSAKLLVGALIAFKLRGAFAFAEGAKTIEANAVTAAASIDGITAAESRAAGASIGAGAGVAAGGATAAAGGSRLARGAGRVVGLLPSPTLLLTYGFFQALTAPKETTIAAGSRNGAKTRVIIRGGKILYEVYGGPGSGVHDLTQKDLQALISSGEVSLTADGRKLIKSRSTSGQTSAAADAQALTEHLSRHGGTASVPPKPPKPPAPVIGLTQRQQTALFQAEGTPGTADDLAALRGQLSIIQRLLKQRGLKAADLNALLQQRNSVQDQIDSILAGDVQKRTDKARKAAEAAKKAAAARKKAEQDRAKAYLALIAHTESGLKAAVEKAKLTTSTSDDLKAADALDAFYKKEASDPRLGQKLRDAFRSKDIAERVAIKKFGQTAAADNRANINEFLSAFQNILGLSGNVGDNAITRAGKTVIVNQHFPHPPTKDGYREAIAAFHANRAVFDG